MRLLAFGRGWLSGVTSRQSLRRTSTNHKQTDLKSTSCSVGRLSIQIQELALVAVVGVENAALREQNASLTAELAALSPQFFDEIEDLKYAHATATSKLKRYEAVYGPLEGRVQGTTPAEISQ